MRRLALFLGSPNKDPDSSGGDADSPGEYRTARYAFQNRQDGEFISSETEFFGEALVEYMRQRGAAPDEVLIMGTSASIWDALFRLFPDEELDEEIYYEVWDAVQDASVSSGELKTVEEFVNRRTDVTVICKLISPGGDRDEQLDILRALSDFTDSGDELTIDITHGLRSMGLTAAAAGDLLTQTRQLEVADIFYGNFSIKTDDGHATVDRISARDELNEWAEAISHFRRTGLLGDIPSLVGRYDSSAETPLRRLDHALVTNQFGNIQQWLHQSLSNLKQDRQQGTPRNRQPTTPFHLFKRDLIAALTDLNHDALADLQLELADRALGHQDYLRAAICAFEAVVSAAAPSKAVRTDGKRRTGVAKFLKETDVITDRTSVQTGDRLTHLRYLRNAVSHGSAPSNDRVRNLLRSPSDTGEFLDSALETARRIVDDIRDDDEIAHRARRFVGD